MNAISIARALDAPEALPVNFFAHPEILPQFILRCQQASPVIANTVIRWMITQRLNFRPRTGAPCDASSMIEVASTAGVIASSEILQIFSLFISISFCKGIKQRC